MDATWAITCNVCGKTPRNTVESPCCGAVFCWECVVDLTQCHCCGLELTANKYKPATAIEKLLNDRRKTEPTPESLATCPECTTRISYSRMEEHLLLCPEMAVQCPNGCEQQLVRKEVADHVRVDCPLTVVSCLYGCGSMNETLTRHTLQTHMDTYAQVHLQYLARKVENQQEVIQRMQNYSIPNCLRHAWQTLREEGKRTAYLKNHFPPSTIYMVVMGVIGLLLLTALPALVQGLFIFICWRKRPSRTGTAPALFGLQALAALGLLYVFFHAPFWVFVFIVAPVAWLCYQSRAELLASFQQAINS